MQWIVTRNREYPSLDPLWRGEARDALHAFDQYAEQEGFALYSEQIDPRPWLGAPGDEPVDPMAGEEGWSLICQTDDGVPWAIMTNFSITALPVFVRSDRIEHLPDCKPEHMSEPDEEGIRDCFNCGLWIHPDDFPTVKVDGYVRGRIGWEQGFRMFPDGIPCLVLQKPVRDLGGDMPEPLVTKQVAERLIPDMVGPDGEPLYAWHGEHLVEFLPEEMGGPEAYVAGPVKELGGLYKVGWGLLWDTRWKETGMRDIELESGLVWRVVGKRQPDEKVSAQRYAELLKLVTNKGNFSLWRTTTTDRSAWILWVCGQPAFLPHVEGEDVEIDEQTALSFVARRLRVGADATDQDHTQEAHYSRGVVITRDGGVAPLEEG
jgi:hypothetical protein